MDQLNENNNKDKKRVKTCKNGCGKSIYWNESENAYFEIDNQRKHICPNWKLSVTKSQNQLSQYGVNVIDTKDEILTEILLKIDRLDRKLDKLGGS